MEVNCFVKVENRVWNVALLLNASYPHHKEDYIIIRADVLALLSTQESRFFSADSQWRGKHTGCGLDEQDG